MIERRNLDRDLSAFFEARSTSRAPADLLETAMGGVEHTNQRPAWQLLPHRIGDWRDGRWAMPASARLVAAAILLLVAVVIGALLVAGSQRRLPPPFGPAKPGLLVVEIAGHIGVMKPDGTGLNILTSAPEVDRFPIWSPDGTRIAFVASRDLSLAVVAMDADGGHRTTLADHLVASGGYRAGGAHF
jgi:WD40 repeat protein